MRGWVYERIVIFYSFSPLMDVDFYQQLSCTTTKPPMKIKDIITITTVAGFCFSTAIAKDDQDALRAKAKISQEAATATALAAVPNGKIKSSEIENEDNKLVWSFDISTPKSKNITEIMIDAKTGKVVSNKVETPKDQKAEAAADKAEAAGKKGW